MRTPGRLAGRSGVLLWAVVALAVGACTSGDEHATIRLDTTEVDLGRGSAAHEVRIDRNDTAHPVAPDTVRARPGDAVRFVVEDRQPHALAFVADSLDPAVRAYLERTRQLSGPPLVNQGATWVVVLREAPPGRYPFFCRSHPRERGVLIVQDEP